MRRVKLLTFIGMLMSITNCSVLSLDILDFFDLDDILKPISTSEDKIRSHGYPAESHYVETSDGYILNVFRLPYSPNLENENEFRPAVLVQHGLGSNSDAWLVSGPDDSLAYNLVDAGYDVWLGNARGNIYSRNNTNISPNESKFWNFTFHEIGYFDLPAMIDYILDKTGQSTLNYVGHSQGTTVYFALLSTRPEYNEKIKTGQLLAPCAFLANSTTIRYKIAPYLANPNSVGFKTFQNIEFFPHNTIIVQILNKLCDFQDRSKLICNLWSNIFGAGDSRKNTTAIGILLETNPAGASSNQIIHFLQLYESDEFRRYDLGEEKNIERYGVEIPPNYDLDKITASTYLYWGESDELCSPPGVQRLISSLPHLTDEFMVADPKWDHTDFLHNNEVKEVVNDPVINIFNQNESK